MMKGEPMRDNDDNNGSPSSSSKRAMDRDATVVFHNKVNPPSKQQQQQTDVINMRKEEEPKEAKKRLLISSGKKESSRFDILETIRQSQELDEANDDGEADNNNNLNSNSAPLRCRQSEPGAFRNAPGLDSIRTEEPRFSLVGVAPQLDRTAFHESDHSLTFGISSKGFEGIDNSNKNNNSTSQFTTNEIIGSDNDIMEEGDDVVKARPVMEDDSKSNINISSLHVAEMVDLEAKKRRSDKKDSRNKLQIAVMVCCFAIATIVIVVCLSVLLEQSHDDDATIQTLGDYDGALNVMESSSSFDENSETGVNNDLILSDLPSYTLESLLDPSSPQSQAMEWLRSHQDIAVMEEWRKRQLFALASFYYASNGPNWPFGLNDDWLDDTRSECHWFSALFGRFGGVGGKLDQYKAFAKEFGTCNEQGEFIAIVFVGGKQMGHSIQQSALPPEVTFLTSLETIQARHHDWYNISLVDVIPSQFVQLTALTTLHYSDTQLTGTIPTYLGLMTNLRELYVTDNALTGTIPSELGLLTNLQSQFGLASNSLTGPIPSELGAISGVSGMYLEKNLLSGPIPSQLGQLTNTRVLRLGHNSQLTGSIPSEMGLLTQMQEFELSTTSVSGSVLAELGALVDSHNLRLLDLEDNPDLSGSIPNNMCSLRDSPCSYWIPKYFSMLEVGEMVDHQESCSLDFDCTTVLCGCHCSCPGG